VARVRQCMGLRLSSMQGTLLQRALRADGAGWRYLRIPSQLTRAKALDHVCRDRYSHSIVNHLRACLGAAVFRRRKPSGELPGRRRRPTRRAR